MRTQNVSEQNQKHFLCPGHKIPQQNSCARGQTGKHLCRQQCVHTMCPRLPGPILVILNRMISDQIALHSVQLQL